jgi:hypothetical protein
VSESFSPPYWLDFFPSRVPLPEAAALFNLSQPALRWHAARVPGLAERRLGRVFVDLERLAELVAARPLAKAPRREPATQEHPVRDGNERLRQDGTTPSRS